MRLSVRAFSFICSKKRRSCSVKLVPNRSFSTSIMLDSVVTSSFVLPVPTSMGPLTLREKGRGLVRTIPFSARSTGFCRSGPEAAFFLPLSVLSCRAIIPAGPPPNPAISTSPGSTLPEKPSSSRAKPLLQPSPVKTPPWLPSANSTSSSLGPLQKEPGIRIVEQYIWTGQRHSSLYFRLVDLLKTRLALPQNSRRRNRSWPAR